MYTLMVDGNPAVNASLDYCRLYADFLLEVGIIPDALEIVKA